MYAGRVCIIPELDLNPLQVELLESNLPLLSHGSGQARYLWVRYFLSSL